MTPHVKEFLTRHKDKLVGNIIDVGSYDVNGSAREVIGRLVGTDMRPGPGVDFVCPVERLTLVFYPGAFDSCVSTETLEHVEAWRGFIRTTWELVKPDGWLVMTMAAPKHGRHDYPADYWRLTEEHLRAIYPGLTVYEELGDVSIGWAVQKRGELGDLRNIEPIAVA